jgi:photosystem II stability/assembly factor-like uncharacterized protein
MLNIKKSFIFLAILPLVLSGCIINFKKTDDAGTSGGLFRTPDLGATWEHSTTIYTPGGEAQNFNGSNITSLSFEADDPAVVYAGSQHDGIFYSYNYGQAWFRTLIGKGTINDIVVHPRYRCTIYVAVHNSIYKTEDCSRSWKQVYFETGTPDSPNIFITSLDIKHSEPNVVFAGNSIGSFLKSTDNGTSWYVTARFPTGIKNLFAQNHSDSSIVYIGTKSNGVYKSIDSGANWENLMELPFDEAEIDEVDFRLLNQLRNANSIFAFESDRSVPDGVVLINKFGMFRLIDGNIWTQIKLLTPKDKEVIYSVLVNPKNSNEIFYGTSQAIYHSVDGGVSWAISNLPTAHNAWLLDFSPDNKYLYLGAYLIQQ